MYVNNLYSRYWEKGDVYYLPSSLMFSLHPIVLLPGYMYMYMYIMYLHALKLHVGSRCTCEVSVLMGCNKDLCVGGGVYRIC